MARGGAIWAEVPSGVSRGRKESGFPEIRVLAPWEASVRRPGLTIHVRRGDVYREEPESRAFPGWRVEEIYRALNAGGTARTPRVGTGCPGMRHEPDPDPGRAPRRHARALSAYNGRARRRYSPPRDRGSIRVEGATHRAACRRGAMKRYEVLSIIGTIVAVGIALGAVVIESNANLHAELRTEMQDLRTEVRTDIADVRTEMQTLRTEVRTDIADVRTDIRALEQRLAGVERRQARTEGLLEGLRDAITARRGEAPPPRKEST